MDNSEINGLIIDTVFDGGAPQECFTPASRIDHAWLVVEKMRETGWNSFALSTCFDGWYADYMQRMGAIMRATGDTAPEAICRAALAAMEAK